MTCRNLNCKLEMFATWQPFAKNVLSMETKFGFAILAYYTWWIIVLLCLLIVLYKLLTNQNFSIGFRVGIQSNRDDTQNLVFEPVLLHRQGQMPVINRNGNNLNTATTSDAQVETN